MYPDIIPIKNACTKIKLISLGLTSGEYFKIVSEQNGLNKIHILNHDMEVISALAIRTEEIAEFFSSEYCELN